MLIKKDRKRRINTAVDGIKKATGDCNGCVVLSAKYCQSSKRIRKLPSLVNRRLFISPMTKYATDWEPQVRWRPNGAIPYNATARFWQEKEDHDQASTSSNT